MSQQAWQDEAAGTISVNGGSEDGVKLAREARTLLLTGESRRRIGSIADMPPRDRADGWADMIREVASRETFLLFAYFPAQVLTSFSPGLEEIDRWSTLVDMYEAWSRSVADRSLNVIEEGGHHIGAAFLTRARWLLLSLPFRIGWDGRIPELDLERIDDGSGRILTLAAQARDEWLAVLGQIDDYPRLKQDIDVEDEARAIASLEITRRRLAEANPGLNLQAAPGPDTADAEIMRYAVSRLLLPRFAVSRVWRVVYGSAGWPIRRATDLAALLCVAALALLLVGLADPASGLLPFAPFLAVAWYGLLALTAAIHPPAAWPWLMRQPASAAVGMLGLAVTPPDWWHDDGHALHAAAWAAVLLGAAGLGYLYLEASSHDVRGLRRAWRPPAIAAFGYLHAVMVSVIGLRFLLPEFAQRPARPPSLSCWWHAAGCGPAALPPWLLVLVAASWSFAAGVFLQIIWDDQPVTAPLAHVSWRRES